MKNFYLMIFLFIGSALIAQENKSNSDLNCKVLGVVINGNNYYLNTANGLVKVNNEKDPYEEYYRKIYNDSTIVNPNTELRPADFNSSINFFNPAIDLSQWTDKYNTFGNQLYLYDFMQVDENGNYIFKPGIIGIIQKELDSSK